MGDAPVAVKASVSMSDEEHRRMEQRLVEIDAAIGAATQWGAYLTALDEERRGIQWCLSKSSEGTHGKGKR